MGRIGQRMTGKTQQGFGLAALGLLAGLVLASGAAVPVGVAVAAAEAALATSATGPSVIAPAASRPVNPFASPSVPAPAAAVAPAPAAPPTQPGPRFTQEELEPLLRRLAADGFSRQTLNRIFHDKRLQRLDRVVTYNVLNPDSARIYEQFVSPFAIRLAKKFHRSHTRSLAGLQGRFGVPPEVICGILLVETQFGRAALHYRLLDVFTTLIVDAAPASVERHQRRMKAEYPELDPSWIEARLAKKADWAYEEMKALLSIRDRLKVRSLYEVKGSYAGAFGMPQFMPSSYAQWAVDGNDDRRVDLDNPSDAMASIANFLVQHGWRADAPLEQKMRAVWEYNRSPHYVRAIFGVALGMTRPTRKRGSAPPQLQPAEQEEPGAQRLNAALDRLTANPRLPEGRAAPMPDARFSDPSPPTDATGPASLDTPPL